MLYRPTHFKQNRFALLRLDHKKKLKMKNFQDDLDNQIIRKISERSIKIRKQIEQTIESYYSKNVPFFFSNVFDERIDRMCPKNIDPYYFLYPSVKIILKSSNFTIYNLEKPDMCFQFDYVEEFNGLLVDLEMKLINKDFLTLINYGDIKKLLHESTLVVSVDDCRDNNEYSYFFIINLNKTGLIDQYGMDSRFYEFYNDYIILDPNPSISRYNYCKDWKDKEYLSDVNVRFINRYYKPLDVKTPVIFETLPYTFDFS